MDGVTDVPEEVLNHFGKALATVISERLVREERVPGLRMSNVGKPCERALWYELNRPEDKAPLTAHTYLKFLYGDILEELMLFLAELAGHEVTGRQDESDIQGIKGHRDAVVDGVLVDVKSASSNSYKKFSYGTLAQNDSFGYIDQLQSYLYAGQSDDQITDKSRAAFLAVDKTTGQFTLDFHENNNVNYDEVYDKKKEMVAQTEVPERGFEPVPMGQSGNMTLGFNCSFCDFKRICWPEARTFLYATGPKDLVVVKKLPLVPEIYMGNAVGGNDSQEAETTS